MDTSIDLVKGKVLRVLILFSIPFLFSNIFQQLYNMIDTFIVGNALDESALAAIGACGAIYELLVGFAVGIGNGLSIIVAKYFGAGDEKMVRKSVGAAIIIGLIVTVVLMIFSVTLLYPMLNLLNTPADIIDEAYSYIGIIGIFVGVMLAYNLLAGFLKAIGNSFMPLVFLIISTVINIILDYIFIVNLGIGIKGAAIATVLAQLISAVLCGVFIYKKYRYILPDKEDMKVDRQLYGELWAQGLSMGFMSSIVSIGTVVLQYSINGLGTMIIAGHTAARKIFAFSTLPITTLGMSITTYVSQNKGAGKKDRILKGAKYANVMTTVWSIIAAVILIPFSEILVRLLSGSENMEVLTNGANYLKFNVLFYIPLGILINMRCILQGIGYKILPLISSIIELLGKVVFTFLLIPDLNYTGVIICEPVVWCLMAIQLTVSFYRNRYIRD
ncbi:MAG: MATE family efflux transporter [Lachnospiraceae bacterium]|nr:MATE family efflux transporter [Lachnospiraceae bacterium]